MSAEQSTFVWQYDSPGAAPTKLIYPTGADPMETHEGRWRGEATCGRHPECGSWVADIDPNTLAQALPLTCPVCAARSGYPELVWRGVVIQCGFCGAAGTIHVIDPSTPWPDEPSECYRCEAPIMVPMTGNAIIH